MIAAEKPSNHWPTSRMCSWAGVSESGFYAWARRGPSATVQRRKVLASEITRVFHESNGVFGYRKVHAAVGLAEGDDSKVVGGALTVGGGVLTGLGPAIGRGIFAVTQNADEAAAISAQIDIVTSGISLSLSHVAERIENIDGPR
jgi:hypothetical protein